MRTILSAAMLLTASGFAYAGQTYDSAGTILAKSAAKIHVISEGHMMLELPSKQTNFEMATPNHPFAGMTGNCMGSAEVKGAAATGGGMCVYTTADGDMAVNRWTVTGVNADGSFNGRWVMVGGNGTMKGVTGGGSYNSLTNRETGTSTIKLTGAITQP